MGRKRPRGVLRLALSWESIALHRAASPTSHPLGRRTEGQKYRFIIERANANASRDSCIFIGRLLITNGGSRPAIWRIALVSTAAARGRSRCHETSSLAHSWQLSLATTCCRSGVVGVSHQRCPRHQMDRASLLRINLRAPLLKFMRNRITRWEIRRVGLLRSDALRWLSLCESRRNRRGVICPLFIHKSDVDT